VAAEPERVGDSYINLVLLLDIWDSIKGNLLLWVLHMQIQSQVISVSRGHFQNTAISKCAQTQTGNFDLKLQTSVLISHLMASLKLLTKFYNMSTLFY
jgi:hypothetical protein